MLFSYHLLYFCTALSLIIMLSSHYHHHKSKTFSQLTQCPFTGTLLLFSDYLQNFFKSLVVGASVKAVDEEGNSALHLALMRQTSTLPPSSSSAVGRVSEQEQDFVTHCNSNFSRPHCMLFNRTIKEL